MLFAWYPLASLGWLSFSLHVSLLSTASSPPTFKSTATTPVLIYQLAIVLRNDLSSLLRLTVPFVALVVLLSSRNRCVFLASISLQRGVIPALGMVLFLRCLSLDRLLCRERRSCLRCCFLFIERSPPTKAPRIPTAYRLCLLKRISVRI